MYHSSAGDRSAQLKRDDTVPISRVAAVRFIIRPRKRHNYLVFWYNSDTKKYHSSPDCVRIAAPTKVVIKIPTVASNHITRLLE